MQAPDPIIPFDKITYDHALDPVPFTYSFSLDGFNDVLGCIYNGSH
jgi:hypothetical protein